LINKSRNKQLINRSKNKNLGDFLQDQIQTEVKVKDAIKDLIKFQKAQRHKLYERLNEKKPFSPMNKRPIGEKELIDLTN
jgi:poly-D-alanine transfer protein DltD